MKLLLCTSLLFFYYSLCIAQNEADSLFETSKGKWPIPVSKYVEIQNNKNILHANCNSADSALRITTDSSYNVIAVHDGQTSRTYEADDEYILIIKFGDYTIIYTGIEKPITQNNSPIKSGQVISRIRKDIDNQYQLRLSLFYKDRQLNVEEWINW